MAPSAPKWWKEGVCYQIWPASYKDSNGDGMGDIPGIISTLDYLKDLGVDYIWLSPMFESPLKDMGYDVSNYEGVNPQFGTMEDMDTLIKEAHARGIRLILDLVVNHTSDQHKWFQESRKSKDNEYSDYYIWKDPKIVNGERHPPNNWAAFFGGSAWVYVEERDQYYMRLFLESMPDLNWENPVTRRAIYKSAIEFWLKKGIDGFRVDTVNLYSKIQSYADAKIREPKAKYQFPADYVVNGPRIHEFLKEQRREALDPYGEDVILVGELGMSSDEDMIKYISPSSRELNMVFDFGVLIAGGDIEKPRHEWRDYTLPEVKAGFANPQRLLKSHDCWPTVFFANHDNQRSVSRFGSKDPQFREQSAKLLALCLGTMSGTLFMYQGEEIGMTGVPKDWSMDEWTDQWWIAYVKEMEEKYPGDEEIRKKVQETFHRYGRDHSRTPVHWSSDKYAGFSTTKPWMRVNDNYPEINVKDQLNDSDSVLSFWKRVLVFRKHHKDALVYGDTEFLDLDNQHTMTFTKTDAKGQKMLVTLNMSDTVQPISKPAGSSGQLGQLLFGTGPSRGEDLQPWEGRVYLMN